MALSADKAIRKAQSCINSGRFDEAQALYREILACFPKNRKAIAGLNNLKAGISAKLVKGDAIPAESLADLSGLLQRGRPQQALEKALPLAAVFPKDAVLFDIIGIAHASLGKYDEAIASYKIAVQIKPDYAAALNNLGNAQIEHSEFDGAIVSFQRALKIEPTFSEALNNLGLVWRKKGNTVAAITHFRQAIKIRPNFANAYRNCGDALRADDDLDAAVGCYQSAIALDPRAPETHNNLGIVLHQKGNLGAAIASFKQAIHYRPDYVDAYSNIANSQADSGDLDSAIESYRQAIAHAPKRVRFYTDMGSILQLKGDLEGALASFEDALAIDPQNYQAFKNIGNLYFQNGDYEAAVGRFKVLSDQDSAAQYLECLYHLGRFAEFDRALDSLADSDPVNIRAASISAFSAHQRRRTDAYPFCKKPLALFNVGNLRDHIADPDALIDDVLSAANTLDATWEPRNKTTKAGFQTSGNLFDDPAPSIAQLEQIIRREIDLYYQKIKAYPSALTDLWPADIKLLGWYVRMGQGGYQDSHIHPRGWVSGVVYLKVPDSVEHSEGAIQLDLHGYRYPITNHDYPRVIHQPACADIVLFPSSTFHRTIAIKRDVERCVIAFDICPSDSLPSSQNTFTLTPG